VRDKGDFPGVRVDEEEGETDYYDPTQLSKHVRDRQVWSPVKFKQLHNYLTIAPLLPLHHCTFFRLAKVHGGTAERHKRDSDNKRHKQHP
jgi:hypothetical protein